MKAQTESMCQGRARRRPSKMAFCLKLIVTLPTAHMLSPRSWAARKWVWRRMWLMLAMSPSLHLC